jgi:N6-L-threonylcarbamoyladenine synthase
MDESRDIKILAIESSCDDTSAAILINGTIKSNITASQLDHSLFGGVVPEVASRQHDIHITMVVDEAIRKAGILVKELSAIAVTKGPGLVGSLHVGVSFAKGLALSLNIPLIAVHHMHAHILSHFIDEPKPNFPFLCLTVSGGHTQIVRVDSYKDMTILGETIDDAAGEAFDKSGKILGLPYPAGPIIDKLAHLGEAKYKFAKPQVSGYNFSFSGFKTSVLYFLQDKMKQDNSFITANLNDICASIQESIIHILLEKLTKAINDTGIKSIAIAGGVSANKGLRNQLTSLAKENDWELFIPDFQYCTDNAGMIGMAAYFKYQDGQFDTQQLTAEPRWPFIH